MSCAPEKVSGFLDGALAAAEQLEVAGHLGSCEACRAQLEAERAVHAALARLEPPEPPFGFESRLRRRLEAGSRVPPLAYARLVAPLAAVFVLAIWARGFAPFVAWEIGRDHRHCFSFSPPPVRVRSPEPAVVADWFVRQGTRLPTLPGHVGSLTLFGGRYCRLADASAVAHLYYTGAEAHLSIFVLDRSVRVGDGYQGPGEPSGVALVKVDDLVVGVVGEHAADVDAAVSQLRSAAGSLRVSLLQR